ncbi:ANTAR domain-containing protein [Cellulomonas sp. NPDC089187]|uniref:ANTAR domain-containing protein n=1 Tax=Cellulomonas sp. NPDC089187 TaxID=3154970 RepID=UPI003416CE37
MSEQKDVTPTTLASTPTGAYRFDACTGAWWWSDSVYTIHGFAAGEVVPTTDLLLSHTHPEDRDELVDRLADDRLSLAYRVIDAHHHEHLCVLVGERQADGLRGYLIDLTDLVNRHGQAVATSAISAAATSRSMIEQAVGAVAFSHQLDPAGAFGLLRAASMDANVPIRSLAAAIVEALPDLGADPRRVRRFLDELRKPKRDRVG